jgi:DNA-binding NtrC family response regulator
MPVAPPEAPQEAPQAPRNEALLRLKKRSRAVVALAPSSAFGDVLKVYLQEEGFGRVLVTHSRKELLEHLQQPNLSVLLFDGDCSTLDALQFLAQLKNTQPVLPPIILAVEEASTAIVLAAHRSGVTQILVKPYALDSAFSELLEQLL